MKDAEKIVRAVAELDAALDGLDNAEVYYALAQSKRVPPGRGMFAQQKAELEAFEDGRLIGAVDVKNETGMHPLVDDVVDTHNTSVVRIPRIPRLPWDQFFMLHAHLAATRSTCDRGPELYFDPGRRGVGAVIVREKRIVAGGYNGSPPGQPHCYALKCDCCGVEFPESHIERAGFVDGQRCPACAPGKLFGGHLLRDGHCVRTLHAEENALLQCALDGVSPEGATVYTTASPCWDCAKRLVRVGVSRLVYSAEYGSRYGLSEDAEGLLEDAGVEMEHLEVSL